MRRWVALGLVVPIAGCHVVTRTEAVRPHAATPQRLPPRPLPPTLIVDDGGHLRFVEPLACPTMVVTTAERAVEITTSPNLATFVVGVIATAVGGVLAVRGVTDRDGAANPFTYAGAALVVGGAPLAVGPWLGTGTELRALPAGPSTRRLGAWEPCGDRPLAARMATLWVRGIEVHGAVDDAGVFAVSPFQLVDAFAASATPAWKVTGRVVDARGSHAVEAIIDRGALASRAAAFLAVADFDARVEPMRVVPAIVPGVLRASLTATPSGPAVRIVLPLRNDGPGPAWALRGHVIAPGTPALDGRIVYVGHLASGAQVTRELLIPIAPAVADELRNVPLEISVELRDAHGTAPTTPVRFRGAMLADAPRS